MVLLLQHQRHVPWKLSVYHQTASAALQGTSLRIGLPDTGPKSGDQLKLWSRRADGHNIAVHLVGLLRDREQDTRSAPDLSMGDVVDENGIADASHEGHPLLAIPRLGGVGQPLQATGTQLMCMFSLQVPSSSQRTHPALESAHVITWLSIYLSAWQRVVPESRKLQPLQVQQEESWRSLYLLADGWAHLDEEGGVADGVPHGQAEALHDVEHLVALLQRDQLPRVRHLHSSRAPSAHKCMMPKTSLTAFWASLSLPGCVDCRLGEKRVGKKYMCRSRFR